MSAGALRSVRGRPRAQDAARKQELLLEVALDIFLKQGFERTTMEDIARGAGMSKRTLYSRYDDKNAIFMAAVRRAAERYTVSREALAKTVAERLDDTLLAVARLRLRNLATPEGLRLQRILASESYRFPELLNAIFESSTGPMVDFLADLFEQQVALGELSLADPRQAAVAFLSLVLGGPARQITAGVPPDPAALDQRLQFAIRLFLNGALPR